MDEFVGESNPAVLRDDLHEVLLDFYGLVVFCELEAAAQAEDVSVYNHADGDLVPASENYVGGLAGHAGDAEHFVHGLRNLVAELLDDRRGRAFDGLCLVVEEAGAANDFFEFGQGSGGHVFGGGVGLEERGRDEVDADVGALRREDSRDGELKGAGMVERADDAGIRLCEDIADGLDALRLQGFSGCAALQADEDGLFSSD